MSAANRSPRKLNIDLKSESFTLSRAKTFLGRLVDKAGRGETGYILRGGRRFILQEVAPIDPIPMRPPGYFANCYSLAEIQDENLLAKASVLAAPKDLD